MTDPYLPLADLAGLTSDAVKDHIAENYAGTESGFSCGSPSDDEKAALRARLNDFSVIVAYEHVGSWGCDSSSYFLLRGPERQLFEVRGGHCSCYGFEGQWDMEQVDISYLRSEQHYVGFGGYDGAADEHQRQINEVILSIEA